MTQQGGVCVEIIDHDTAFLQAGQPLLVNDYDLSIEEDREKLNSHLRVNHDSDTFSTMPRCFCGALRGGEKVGRTCDVCHTVVSPITEELFESNLWLKAPLGTKGFINPEIYSLLVEPFNIKGFNPLEYLIDRQYVPAKGGADYKNKEIYQLVASLNIPRGINSFIENFDLIMTTLLSSQVVKSALPSAEALRGYAGIYTRYRKQMFCGYLQMPSKLIFIVESNATGRYAAPEMKLAQDAALTVCSARREITSARDVAYNETIAIKVSRQLAHFYQKHDTEIFAGKTGSIRKNIGGSRMPFTARCVIISKTGVHDMDTITLPRCIVIPLFKFHILNYLNKMGFSPTDSLLRILSSIKQADEVIDGILDKIEADTTNSRVRGWLLRNPTLRWLSNRTFKVAFNRDLEEIAIRLSTLSINPSNADFDGDELNFMLQFDDVSMRYGEAFGSHNCVLDMNSPITVSSGIDLPATLISTINRWAYSHD